MTHAPAPSVPATTHTFRQADARGRLDLADASVDLVLTSPPYPMIAMWDDAFRAMNPAAGRALDSGDGEAAFALMHAELDRAWDECLRVTRPGGFLCLNVGDATRTVDGTFRLYPNHSRVEQFFLGRGADVLPRIIWRKATNAPNKFMGSGVLPAGAYVTLEHEYILIFRKHGKRDFSSAAEKARRRASAIFWEERNDWYSDLWELKGERQTLAPAAPGELFAGASAPLRTRSAAYPFEIAFRLVAMHSVRGDLVLDPFAGTGTTALAAAALGRNSTGIDVDPGLTAAAGTRLAGTADELARLARARLARHRAFVAAHAAAGKTLKYTNARYGFPVKTRQETGLVVPVPSAVAAGSLSGIWAMEYEA